MGPMFNPKLPMLEKYVDELVGIWYCNGTLGGVPLLESSVHGNLIATDQATVAALVEAQSRFRLALYNILCKENSNVKAE